MTSSRRARCPSCGSSEPLTVTLAEHGDPISFSLCECGWKNWTRGEEGIDPEVAWSILGTRLEAARKASQAGRRRDRGAG